VGSSPPPSPPQLHVADSDTGGTENDQKDDASYASATGAGETLPCKDADSIFLADVRNGVIKRWIMVILERSERHSRRGASAQLQPNKVANHLADQSNFIKRRGLSMRAVARLINSAVNFAKKFRDTAKDCTGSVSDGPAGKVARNVAAQALFLRSMETDEKIILETTAVASTLVGGVQRGGPTFEGALPDEAPLAFINLIMDGLDGSEGGSCEDAGLGSLEEGGGWDLVTLRTHREMRAANRHKRSSSNHLAALGVRREGEVLVL